MLVMKGQCAMTPKSAKSLANTRNTSDIIMPLSIDTYVTIILISVEFNLAQPVIVRIILFVHKVP